MPFIQGSTRKMFRSLPVMVAFFLIVGCAILDPKPAGTPILSDQGKELIKQPLPYYYLEPPDIIIVEVIKIVPKPPYKLRVEDVIHLDVLGVPDEENLTGDYTIQAGGTIAMGTYYGNVKVGGLTIEEAEQAVTFALKKRLKSPEVSAQLARMSTMQVINGTHLIAPDGYITLGSYGRVYVSGLTLDECRDQIELFLSSQLENPVVSVDVFAYNSKEYYVVLQGGPSGDQLYSFAYTGNETVLKAIANVNGLQPFSSKRIWIARPVGNTNHPLILPVDWTAVTAYAQPQTNYQILPGDRVFVQMDNWVALDQRLAKVFAPFERIMGFMLLSASTISRYSGSVRGGGGDSRN